jgi:hypothetical protein
MYSATCDWGNIDNPKFNFTQLQHMKQNCQKPLLFHAEPQSRVLLQRCPGDQVRMEANEESISGRSSKL